jgi:outer membrane protein TolC
VPLAEQRREQAENTLRFLIGDPPTRFHALAHQARSTSRTICQPACRRSSVSRRPDVRQAENELHAATAQIGVALGSRFLT